jgi:hypothetical protein
MITPTRIAIIAASIIITGFALAREPKELIDARRNFEALRHPASDAPANRWPFQCLAFT